MLDKIKELGFKYSTRGAITVSVTDIEIPKEKAELVQQAEDKVQQVENAYADGLISDQERYEHVVNTWKDTTDAVTKALLEHLDEFNNIYMMANSGARGNTSQIRQLAGMRGLIAGPSGRIIEVPIRANFREGLSVLEFFISAHGARKGLADTALRTAESGYLTRRLVDVSQDVIVRSEDCFHERNETPRGITVAALQDGHRMVENLADRIWGRVPVKDILHPETGEVIAPAGEIIQKDVAEAVEAAGIEKVEIRSVLTCRSEQGVCVKCYGMNLATGHSVRVGEATGTIAAQAIGEPGTQLTMRTFHTGGVAQTEDITQGLPRVEELFEARKPKDVAVISEIAGTVSISAENGREITVSNVDGEAKTYTIPFDARPKVEEGQKIEAGTPLNSGSINPHDILKINGVKGVQEYLLNEVQTVYRLQGVETADKHIEVILRQMMRKVKIDEIGGHRHAAGLTG